MQLFLKNDLLHDLEMQLLSLFYFYMFHLLKTNFFVDAQKSLRFLYLWTAINSKE